MGFRFWRRIRIAPGLRLNLSKAGASLSFGPRGATTTVGRRGSRATVGVPGTGLFYTVREPRGRAGRKGSRRPAAAAAPAGPSVPPDQRLRLGFFKRLVTPDDEEALVDGCRHLVLGHERRAMDLLRGATHLADGAALAGFLALKHERLEEAERCLAAAARRGRELGRRFAKYGIAPVLTVPITDHVAAHVEPDLRGVLLALVEVHQRTGEWRRAIPCLRRLRRLEPDDVVVRLSLAELLAETRPDDGRTAKAIVRLAEDVENETPVHAALLLYKAKALRTLGLHTAARDALTAALRRKKGRPADLLRAIRYERAGVYEQLGRRSRARSELGKLYAQDPDYEDVAQRLGLA
ncbi:MAG: DUF4236 domain-containing protein [Candidatus Brocadiia bacterium]